MTGLLTDLYQLTMAAGYFEAGKAGEIATFELFFRNLPRYRNYVVAAGLEQVVEYLSNLRFTDEEIAYLRTLPQFQRVSPDFFDVLRNLRFTDCRLLDAILPSAPELHAMGEHEVQDTASHFGPCLFRGALSRE